jgi:hypothetical protein
MKILKAIVLFALIAIPMSICNGKITCSALISDNILLHRNNIVKFRGNTDVGDKITPKDWLYLASAQMTGVNNHL